jgi:hypothetical protein
MLPKNMASLISDSLATTRGESAPEAEEPMDDVTALGQTILDAIKSGDARSVGESFRSFVEAVSVMPPSEELSMDVPVDESTPELPPSEEG